MATFFVPLIFIPATYIFPFIVPKIVLFRSLVLLMLFGFVLLAMGNWSRYKPQFTPVSIAVVLLWLSFAISSFVGVDTYRSVWDNHERMLGLFTFTHYVFYYFIVTSVVHEWREWKWLLRLFLIAGSLVMFIGVLQKFVNPELLMNRGMDRVSATLGNSIYYSGYGLFLFFLGSYLSTREQQMNWKWVAYGGAFLGFLGIFLGGTRGAVVGLFAGLLVAFISYLITLKEHKKIRQMLGGILLGGAILLSVLFAFRDTSFVQGIPAVGRLVNTSLGSGTADTRIMAWGIAVDAWKERPVFGWGPNNYYHAFNEYYRPEFLRHGIGETWFDNAHNIIMNTLAVQGTVGIIAYLGLFGTTIIMLWRAWQKGETDAHTVGFGSAFLVAHLVSNIFVFENPTSYLYFFFLLAFINSQIIPSQVALPVKSVKKVDPTVFSLVFGIVIFLLVFSTNVNVARANKATMRAIQGLAPGQNVTALYQEAINYPTPHIDDIRNDFFRYAMQIIPEKVQRNGVTEEVRTLFALGNAELRKNIELHPLDIRVRMNLAELLQLSAQVEQNPARLVEAEQVLTEATVLSPKRQQVRSMLATIKIHLGKNDEAVQLLQENIELDPVVGEPWVRMLLTQEYLGNPDRVREVLAEMKVRELVLTAGEQAVYEELKSKYEVESDK